MGIERKPLPEAEKLLLWVRSGGICAYPNCKKSLLLEDFDAIINIGKKAHIIAHSPEGPRGNARDGFSLSEEEINSHKNYLLLCGEHHDIIDKNYKRYPPKLLFEWKRDHENWIEQLKQKASSIAVIHKTKGGPIDHIMLAQSLGLQILDLAIFQEEFKDFSEEGWLRAKQINEHLVNQVKASISKFEGCCISIFALSHIPLLVHLGQLITDTIPVSVFQYDRHENTWVANLPKGHQLEDVELIDSFSPRGAKKLIIAMGISGTISVEDIKDVVDYESSDFLDISLNDPQKDKVLYKEHIDKVKKVFMNTTETLIQKNSYDEIHLFYVGPAGLAIELGRCINPSMWPYVYLYNFDYRQKPKYQKAFAI